MESNAEVLIKINMLKSGEWMWSQHYFETDVPSIRLPLQMYGHMNKNDTSAFVPQNLVPEPNGDFNSLLAKLFLDENFYSKCLSSLRFDFSTMENVSWDQDLSCFHIDIPGFFYFQPSSYPHKLDQYQIDVWSPSAPTVVSVFEIANGKPIDFHGSTISSKMWYDKKCLVV